MPSEIRITDNSAEVLKEFEAACLKALEECGLIAEGYAKRLAVVDTGLLRNSITYALSGKSPAISTYHADRGPKKGSYSGTMPDESKGYAVYIGTNVDYGAYNELGTGIHATMGGGSPPWVFPIEMPDGTVQFRKTSGMEARPFIKPSVADHAGEYREIIQDNLKGK